MKIVLEVDDLAPSKPGLELLFQLKEHYPQLQVTCFTPALDEKVANNQMPEKQLLKWAEILRNNPWIEIAPHGLVHVNHEMECSYDEAKNIIQACEDAFNKINVPFVKIWRSPYWQTSIEAYEALRDSGYVVCVDKNQPLPNIPGLEMFIFNKSLEQPFTEADMSAEVIKWHGHIGGKFYNDISWSINAITTAPEDAEFLKVSEYIKLYGTEKIA